MSAVYNMTAENGWHFALLFHLTIPFLSCISLNRLDAFATPPRPSPRVPLVSVEHDHFSMTSKGSPTFLGPSRRGRETPESDRPEFGVKNKQRGGGPCTSTSKFAVCFAGDLNVCHFSHALHAYNGEFCGEERGEVGLFWYLGVTRAVLRTSRVTWAPSFLYIFANLRDPGNATFHGKNLRF